MDCGRLPFTAFSNDTWSPQRIFHSNSTSTDFLLLVPRRTIFYSEWGLLITQRSQVLKLNYYNIRYLTYDLLPHRFLCTITVRLSLGTSMSAVWKANLISKYHDTVVSLAPQHSADALCRVSHRVKRQEVIFSYLKHGFMKKRMCYHNIAYNKITSFRNLCKHNQNIRNAQHFKVCNITKNL